MSNARVIYLVGSLRVSASIATREQFLASRSTHRQHQDADRHHGGLRCSRKAVHENSDCPLGRL